MALCVIVLLGVALIMEKTRLGMSLRAVADIKDLAEASGIDVNRVHPPHVDRLRRARGARRRAVRDQ